MTDIAAPAPMARRSLRFDRIAPALLVVLALLIYAIVATATQQMQYLTFDNFVQILARSIALGITAVGQTFVILLASIDLSVANLISASAVLASVIMAGQPAMIVPAIAAVLALGLVVGTINGLVVARLGVNPLIATLGMAFIIQGCLSAFVNNFAGSVPEEFQAFAYGQIGPIPWSLVFLAALAVLAWFVLRFTKFGSDIYAVGGNPDAARVAGIKTWQVILYGHIICSLTAVIAGLYLASRLRSGAPWIGADGAYDLQSIAVTVIGGTVLSGGRGGIWGTMAGVLIFSLIDAIFNLTGLAAVVGVQGMLRGVIIVAAVAFYAVRSRKIVA
jgi:ribose transport system permease protein